MKRIRCLLAFFNHLKIRDKLLSVYGLIVVLPILSVGVYLNKEVQSMMINQMLEETSANMNRIEERLNHLFDRVLQVADLITVNDHLQKLATHEYQNNLEVFMMHRQYPLFDEYLTHYEDIFEIRFYSLNPTHLNAGHFFKATEAIINEDWFQDAVQRNGRVAWILKTDELTNSDYFTLTRLIKDRDETMLGVLNIYVSSHQLKTIFQDEPYDVMMSLNQETIIFQEGELLMGETAPFIDQPEAVNQVSDVLYDDRVVTLNGRRFKPHRVLDGEVQIVTVIPIEQITIKVKAVMDQVFIVVGICLLATLMFILFFIKSFSERVNLLKAAMDQVASGNFTIKSSIAGKDEIKEIYQQLYQTMMSIQGLMGEIYRQKLQNETWKTKQKESEFKWLASQMNPHFLYNTLEMIRVKAIKHDGQDIAQIVTLLSKLLRRSLESQDQVILLQQEIEFVKMYLDIQKLRFKDKIDYELQIEVRCDEYQIIPLLIQPLVENAFIHGVELKEGNGTIKIAIFERDHVLVVVVSDNGIGMACERLAEIEKGLNQGIETDGSSIGLHNVQQRIHLYYGTPYGVEVKSRVNEGTTVTLYLPKSQ